MADAKGTKDRSLGELLRDLTRDIGNLVRQEIELAKTEATQKATKIAKSLVFVVIGALFGLGAFLASIAFLIAALHVFLPLWLAALLVTLGFGALAAVFALTGIKKIKAVNPVPQQTLETLKEDAQWAKNQLKTPSPTPSAPASSALTSSANAEVKL